jgi:hypothetical protein
MGGVRGPWFGLAALHSLGTVLAATATGVLLMAMGWALDRAVGPLGVVMPWVMVLVAGLYVPRELGLLALPPLVQSVRQVPRRWAFRFQPPLTALLFGLGLGSGFYTRLVVPTFYLLVLWPFTLPGSLWPAGMWAVYGLTRSANLWWFAATASAADISMGSIEFTSALARWGDRMHRANALLLALVAAWLLLQRNLG